MALPVKKYYKGAAANAVLTSSPSSGDTTMTVDTVTGWPASFPFYAVIDPGTSKEEKVRVTAISTLTLTVVRAQDETTAVGHTSGAAIYPVFTAIEASEANEIASVMTTKGDLITNDGTTINRLAVGGTNTHVLQVDSTAANGIKWGQVATAGIADSAVTSAKIADATIVAGDIATATLKLLCPVGTISAYGGASAPTGWLLCDGTAINASYTELIALVGANTPDMKGKFALGKTAAGTGSTLLGSGGSTTIAEANLPSHTHTINHNHAAFNTSGSDGTHTHTISDPGHTHVTNVSFGNGGANSGPYYFNEGTQIDGPATDSSTTGVTVTSTNSAHTHSIDVPELTGVSSGNGTGSGTAYFQPFVAVSYIIKHDY